MSSTREAAPETSPGWASRTTKALLGIVALVAVFLLFATAYSPIGAGSLDVKRLGVATVESCTEHGPITMHGFGFTYSCQATIHWKDGDVDRHRRLPVGVASPEDIGERVPVYMTETSSYQQDGIPDDVERIGNNENASFSAWKPPLVITSSILMLFLIGFIVGQAPPRRKKRKQNAESGTDKWPVTRADRRGVSYPKIVWRWRLLACWALLGLFLVMAGTIPRFSAPRVLLGQSYDSPWPQIAASHLIDPYPALLTALFELLALLLMLIGIASRNKAARAVKYGPAFMAKRDAEDRDPVEKIRAESEPSEGTGDVRWVSLLLSGAVFAGLGTWATVSFLQHLPNGAPPLVVLGCARDLILLVALLVIWLVTRQPRHVKKRMLLQQHEQRHGPATSESTRAEETATAEQDGTVSPDDERSALG